VPGVGSANTTLAPDTDDRAGGGRHRDLVCGAAAGRAGVRAGALGVPECQSAGTGAARAWAAWAALALAYLLTPGLARRGAPDDTERDQPERGAGLLTGLAATLTAALSFCCSCWVERGRW